MSILSRLIKRNILGKPLRSFAIIIALAASAFALLFCISGREAPEHVMRDMLLRTYGGAELLAMDSKSDLKLNAADFPKGTKMYNFSAISVKAGSAKGVYSASAGYYDSGVGKQLRLFDSELDPKHGAIISEAFAQKAGLKEGDTVTLTAVGLEEADAKKTSKLSLKVVEISKDKFLVRKNDTILISMDNFRKLSGKPGCKTALIDLPDDVDAKQFAIDIFKKYSDKKYAFSPILSDDLLDEIGSQTMVFYLIFAVILLMTLFLTFSMSRHIANERLSTIGTLRSIGGSIPKTSTLLIIESAVYGLVGGILGAVLFVFAGDFAVQAFFGSTGDYSMPLWWYPLSVVLAIAIQIICQSGAIIKAVRTPVRDIIFSSRDTAYVLSIKKIVIGAVLLAAGITVGIFAEETIPSIAAIALICVGSVMIVPIAVKGLSKLFVRVFAVLGMSTAKFAANECSHKKSSVTGTQFTFIALAITIGVFITGNAVAAEYNSDVYHYDVKVSVNKPLEKCEFITKLPEVKDSELFMEFNVYSSVNGSKRALTSIIAYSDFKLYPIVTDLGKEPAWGEAYIGADYAGKLGVKKGDTVKIVDTDDTIIDEKGNEQRPEYTLKIIGTSNVIPEYRNSFIVNKQWYQKELVGNVDNIYINFSKQGNVESLRSKIENKLPNAYITTAQQSKQNKEEDCSQLMTIIYSILGVGCVLALLGAVSNAIIGFEQSKRKYAVLHSVAAGKKKLSKLIIIETLFSSLIAGGLAAILGIMLTKLIGTTLDNTGITVVMQYDPLLISGFLLLLIAVLMIAAVKPIMSLRKMNTAAELKYE